jgi:hypothetical protein
MSTESASAHLEDETLRMRRLVGVPAGVLDRLVAIRLLSSQISVRSCKDKQEATPPVVRRVWLAAEHDGGVFVDDAGDCGDAGHRGPVHRGGGPVARGPGERGSSNWLHPGCRPAHGRGDHRAGRAAQRQCGRVPDA